MISLNLTLISLPQSASLPPVKFMALHQTKCLQAVVPKFNIDKSYLRNLIQNTNCNPSNNHVFLSGHLLAPVVKENKCLSVAACSSSAPPSCLSLRGTPSLLPPTPTRMRHVSPHWLTGMFLLWLLQTATSMVMLPNSTGWEQILDKYLDEEGDWWEAKHRGKRAITDSDAQLILDLHNKLRGQVYPPASNMEHMVSG